MIVEAIKRMMTGIAFGGLITFIVLTIIYFNEIETTIFYVWASMLCSFIIGIYFGLSSFIFETNDWSLLKQTIIHLIMSISFYLIIALIVGWVPLTILAILWTCLVFIIFYAIMWTGYYLYYKRIEKSMNESLSRKD
ncbi:DUF3021 domain-containing protein [Halalkalibacter hemicellulosilyticus]|uniref:DUF3021 domain-containing protein n=1 Tax=Halalkalibacter hemicellulosilyticusJCM 9152 TaxID=1236971 RepID=W4Q9N3_9BACI|nr:DUF3021 domain-containing protein [Halalkalibacter hemicellulosilyticus]GAE28710.1 hypothetical protein JCM9152_38 [Halalkalibacter hemicellulosilyticusJCM 9152]